MNISSMAYSSEFSLFLFFFFKSKYVAYLLLIFVYYDDADKCHFKSQSQIISLWGRGFSSGL